MADTKLQTTAGDEDPKILDLRARQHALETTQGLFRSSAAFLCTHSHNCPVDLAERKTTASAIMAMLKAFNSGPLALPAQFSRSRSPSSPGQRKCPTCLRQIEGPYVIAFGKYYHAEHLLCRYCGSTAVEM